MCKPTAVQKNKTNVQQNQVQKNEQEAQALLKQFQVKQDVMLQNKKMEEQLFKTYVEDQDTYKKEWPLSSKHKLDTKVFNNIKERFLEKDSKFVPGYDMDVADFLNKKVNDTKTILAETDNYQKSKGYKSVSGREEMMEKGFSFNKYVLSKDQLEAIECVKENDKESIEDAVKAVDTALAKCKNIKTKAKQKASDDNFEVSKLSEKQKTQISNLKSIWDLLSDFDKPLNKTENPVGAKAIFNKSDFRSYSEVLVKLKKAGSKKQESMIFDWDKVKIIQSCMVKGVGKEVRSMEKTEDLKAFTDEMTVAIAKMIAEFLVEKYNIDPAGTTYEKLLINLVSARYFDKDNHVINLDNQDMRSADDRLLKELDFAELFKANHDPVEDLLKLRNYSEQVLEIEENKAYQEAGSKRVDSLTEHMDRTKERFKNTLSVFYQQMGKDVDNSEAFLKKRIEDPEINGKIKAEIEAQINDYNSYKQAIIESIPNFDLKGRSIGDIKLTEIKAIGKDASYESIREIGQVYLGGLGKMDDFTYWDKNDVNRYEAAERIFDCTEKLADMVKVTIEKNGDKGTGQIRTTDYKITDEAFENLKKSCRDLEKTLRKKVKKICDKNKSAHPELENYANGNWRISINEFFNENLKPEYDFMLKELKDSDEGNVLFATLSEIRSVSKAIDKYRNDLVDVISKKEDVKEYYSNISEVENNLKDIKERLDCTYLDPTTYQEYQKADEFKSKFEAMLALSTDMYKTSKSDKDSEQQKIDVGRRTYKLLEGFQKFKNELAENDSLQKSVQGRKLIEKTVRMQESLVDRLVEEKKEELAFYEGNLLKIKINEFRKKNGKIDEKIENLRKQNENNDSTDAEKALLKYVEEYNALKEDMDAYLERYVELKNNSYYVKEVAVVEETVTRQLRNIDSARLFGCYKDLVETDEYLESIHKGAYSDEDKLADKYQSFVEKVSGRNKFGTFDNQKKIDGKNIDKNLELEITDKEIEEGLDSVLDIALVSARMKKAGLNSKIILQKMNYPGDILKDIFTERGTGTYISVLSDSKVAQKWFKTKAEQFVKSCEKVVIEAKTKAENSFKDRNFLNVAEIGMYIVAQTQLGTQIEVLRQIGKALKIKPENELESLYEEIKFSKEDASKNQGFEEDNKDILYEEGLKAYSELKADNNREVVYKKESQAILDKLTAFNADLGKDELKFTADYNKLLEAEKLRTSNSKEFDNVKKAAAVVNDLSSEMKNLATDPQLYAKDVVKEKLDAINQAYDDLLKATRTYITTRSVFYRGRSDSGKKRLAAIKEIEEHAKAQKAAYAALEIPMVAYKKDETIDVSAYVQKLNAFKEQKKDLFYDTFVDFKDRFKDLLDYNGSEDTLDSTAGVNLFVDLKKEELLLQKQAVDEIVAGAEKIRLECTKTDAKSNKAAMYSKWIRCFDFYKKYENSCPQDAKEAVESIRVMARDYLNGSDAEGVVTNLNAEKKQLRTLALKIKNGQELSTEEKARAMRLRFRYDPFMTGVKKYKKDYKKDPNFVADYKDALEDFDLINRKVASYSNDPETFKEILGSAKTKMDQDLAHAREVIADHAYVLTDMKGKAALTIKNTLEEITYFFSLYVYNKENSGISEDEIQFYNAQKNNLEELLTSNIAKMLVEEDYGAVYEKTNEKAEAGYTTSLKNIVPVDKRMEEYRAYMNKTSEEKTAERITAEDQVSHTLRYIVQVEAENAQLQDIKTLSKTSPYMANELEKQLEVRRQFEKQLVGLNKEKDKEKITTLMKAMVNTAGDYYKILKAKENKILGQQMSSDQERMLYYFTSFSKYYDEAKIYVTMMKKWSQTLGVKLTGSNYAKLADIVGRIDLKAQENIRFNHITDADLNAKKKLGYLKNEATLAAYTTQKVCKERDEDFALTMEKIKEVKLNSTNSFRVNDLVKESRIFGGDRKYDSLKVDKSKNFTLFGFTLWGKVDRSLDDFIARVYKYTLKYEELKEPLEELVKLGGYAKNAVRNDSLTQAEAAQEFKKSLENINLKMLKASSKMLTNHFREDHRRSYYRIDAERRNVMEGWTDFYQIFKELGKQLDDYADRNPSGDNVVLNSKAKKDHASFVTRMASIGTGATDVDTQEKRFFAVMQYINENQYAESAYEHSSNVEYTMYRDYLVSWFENLCYKEAQSALRGIEMTKDVKVLAEQYDGFLNILEKYAASKAISRKTHDYLKAYVFNACKKQNDAMQDKSYKELAKIRAKVVYDNVIANHDLENIVKFTPETRERWEKLGMYNSSNNKLNAEFLGQIQVLAETGAELEIRGTKEDKLSDTTEKLLNDGAEFAAGAQKVLYSEGGWWFVLKDYINYAIGETQAAYFKVKNA